MKQRTRITIGAGIPLIAGIMAALAGDPSSSPPPPARPAPNATYLSRDENEVVLELNRARTAPKEYAAFIKDLRRHYNSDGVIALPGKTRVITVEGVKAVDEAIVYLEKANPLPPLAPSPGMSRAARDHALDIGPRGETGHTGSDKSTIPVRLSRHGKWHQICGENIACGWKEARHIVMQLIIDDDVPNRGHRTNIFTREYGKVGLALARHKTYRDVCVMDFAGDYTDK